MTAVTHSPTGRRSESPAGLLSGWDAIELWVGNARAVTQLLVAGFGFECVAYSGPETGQAERCSYALGQGDIRLVVTAALDPRSEMWDHVRRHGDGVRALSFRVRDVPAAFNAAVNRGAEVVAPPSCRRDAGGEVESASVRTYGETIHRFTRRDHATFAPGFTDEYRVVAAIGDPVGLTAVDHVVGNVPQGQLPRWVAFYQDVFGFHEMSHFDRDQISTEFSALRSTVMTNGAGITMPLNEPAEGRKRSQIQEYIDAYGGPGVQHIALGTEDIVAAVSELARRGIRFLRPPAAYYDEARARFAHCSAALAWDDLARLGILVDLEGEGYLLQVFSEPISDRPTLFLEVIERHGATGFGEGNFKALFEAIEAEQARRGNL